MCSRLHNETVLIGSWASMLQPISTSSFAPPSPTITRHFGHGDAYCGVRAARQAWKKTTPLMALYDRRLESSLLPLVESAQRTWRSVDSGAVILRAKFYCAPIVYLPRMEAYIETYMNPIEVAGQGEALISAVEADALMCRTEGMHFHPERLSLSSITSFSSMPVSLEMNANWA
jgi:hypothetical protein